MRKKNQKMWDSSMKSGQRDNGRRGSVQEQMTKQVINAEYKVKLIHVEGHDTSFNVII